MVPVSWAGVSAGWDFLVQTTKFFLYSSKRATLVSRDSFERLVLRASTAIPTVWAYFGLKPAAFSSSRVNPRPKRILALYFCVGQWITGRSLLSGRGAIAAALAARVRRRDFLREAWFKLMRTFNGPRDDWSHFLWQWMFGTTLLCFTMLEN